MIESDGQKLVLWGDLLHAAAVQFPDPSVTVAFDTDSKSAAAERKKADADAEERLPRGHHARLVPGRGPRPRLGQGLPVAAGELYLAEVNA